MKQSKFKTQVNKEHYFNPNYDYVNKFISYFYQIDSISNLKDIKSVLEVGIGNKTVSNYLKTNGFKVTTCDFDKSLKPDKVADVRNLPFNKNQFDVVLCSEVLEHIPLKDVHKALSELAQKNIDSYKSGLQKLSRLNSLHNQAIDYASLLDHATQQKNPPQTKHQIIMYLFTP